MHPEDRVLVGVMTRAKDFMLAQEYHWYRIPVGKAQRGLTSQYIAFFFSKRIAGKQSGGIYFYAPITGMELSTRAQLIPDEPNHERAHHEYHVIQFREILATQHPILNPSKRRFSFIYTTWDRFVDAKTIDDLYSQADHLVDRVFYTLQDEGYRPARLWELEAEYPVQGAQVRVLCEHGEVVASTVAGEGLTIDDDLPASVERIRQEIRAQGGPKMLSVPVE